MSCISLAHCVLFALCLKSYAFHLPREVCMGMIRVRAIPRYGFFLMIANVSECCLIAKAETRVVCMGVRVEHYLINFWIKLSFPCGSESTGSQRLF